MLGVTCEECSSDRFQESYTVWFQKLLTSLQVISCSFAMAALNSLASFLVFFLFENTSVIVQCTFETSFVLEVNVALK